MSMPVDEYENVLCPLPVLAIDRSAIREWSEHERGPMPAPVVEPCGELVVVTWEVCQPGLGLDADAEPPTDGLVWKVTCNGGHVLVVQRIEDEYDVDRLPYVAETVASALASLGGPS